MRMKAVIVLAVLAAGCSKPAEPAANRIAAANQAAPAPPAPAPVTPPAPGRPEGLPDDGTPVSEAPFDARSAQGAANVVQTYFAEIEARRYAAAWRLWDGAGEGSGVDARGFAAAFAAYAEYHAQVGAPGEMEGAAGSSYVEIPVVVYGRRAGGAEFRQRGSVRLRRVNDVPGSSAEQRRWHLDRSTVEPALGPR